jgi:hypothetical protein
VTNAAAKRRTVLEIKMRILSHMPKPPKALKMKPATNRVADHGRKPETLQQ